ncbi:MAG: hypothetical protein POG24_11985, partial [Acidocella sp.]|nr:hypothetical protein [Acidocella sp.]
RAVSDLQLKLAVTAAADGVEQVGEVRLLARLLPDLAAKDLRPVAEALRRALGSGVVVVLSTEGDKASLVVAVSHDLAPRYDAVALA